MKDWLAKRKLSISLVVCIIGAMLLPVFRDLQMTVKDWGEHTVIVLVVAAIIAVFIEYMLKKK